MNSQSCVIVNTGDEFVLLELRTAVETKGSF